MHRTINRVTWKFFFIAVLLVATTIAAGEAFARFILGLGDPPLSMSHPEIEYLFGPSQDIRRFGNRVLINEYGMRTPSFPKKKMPNELRVLALGDSVLNGGNLTDHDRLATTIVSRELSSALKRRVIIANASAGSWGPANQLAYVRNFGLFGADAVVIVLSSHDADDEPTFEELDPNTHPTRKPALAIWEGVTRYLPRYVPLWREQNQSEASQEQTSSEMRSLPALISLMRFVHKSGTPICLIQHLAMHELASGREDAGFAEIKKIALEQAVETDSTRKALLSRLSEGRSPFRDNIHLNDEGQAALAEVMSSLVKRCVKH